jgi:perosamine synthetase
MSIPIFRPSVKRKELDSVLSTMVEDRLGHGTVAQTLVKEVGMYLGLDTGIALREYGRAIETAIECLEISRGEKIAISPLAPSIYMEVFFSRGIEPVFVDIDPDSGCMATEQLQLLPNGPVKAIVVTGTLGFIPDLEAVAGLGVPIIEDVTQCIGANTGMRKCGSYGSVVILGMEPEDIITSGGGALVFARAKRETANLKRISSIYPKTVFLQDMNAALGIVQIRSIEAFIAQRKEIAQVYTRALMRSRHRTLVQIGEAENVHYSFPVLLDSGVKDVRQYARKRNVDTTLAFEDSIYGKFEVTDQPCPHAQSMILRCVLFPLYPSLGRKHAGEVEKVLSTLP